MSKVPTIQSSTKKICISIDFGTSRTGFTYSFYGDPKVSFKTKLDWPDALVPYAKTLTKIVYKNSKAIAWGYSAEKYIAEQDDPKLILLKYFKMQLFKSTDGKFEDPDYPGVKFQVIDVIVDYLKFLHQIIKPIIEKFKIKDDEIRWCLTIPAIWKDEQKKSMKIAAYKSGIIPSENVSDKDFLLVLEPEAAAAYCLHIMKDSGKSMRKNENFMIIDAGGGTIDLTCHSIQSNGKLKEIVTGSGGPFGSSMLDEEFWKYLYTIIDKKLLDEFRKEYPLEVFELMSNWEKTKCSVKTLVVKKD